MAAVAAELEGEVSFVGIAGADRIGAMRTFVDDFGVGGFPHMADESGEVWSKFRVTSQPSFAFIDDSGAIEVYRGGLSEDDLRERAAALISQ